MSTTSYQPDPNHPSFCQICGRVVANEADRLAGNAFHCGLCNEVRLASPASTGSGTTGTVAGSAAMPDAGRAGAASGVPPFSPFAAGPFPPASTRAAANPGLAALLGVIPGVGAMYNGQYAKGVVHLIVFAVLVSLADSHDIFGWFVAGWICYQAIEAHHTARARRDGTPLPNPFGLNDIGERFGFGKAWASPPTAASPVIPVAGAQAVPGTGGAPFQTSGSNWGAPLESGRTYPPGGSPYAATPYPATPFPGTPYPDSPYPGSPFAGYANPSSYGGQVPPTPPHAPVFDGQEFVPFDPAHAGFDPGYPAARSRFPAGAIWLIGLGTLFLLNTSGMFRWVNFHLLLPLFFLGLGVWTFAHKMTDSGQSLVDDGSTGYRIRLFRAARGSVWLILLGVIFFLADFDILPWSRSWPLFLILAGVMTFLERAVYSNASATEYGFPPTSAQPFASPAQPAPASATAPVAGTAVSETTPSGTPNQEGR